MCSRSPATGFGRTSSLQNAQNSVQIDARSHAIESQKNCPLKVCLSVWLYLEVILLMKRYQKISFLWRLLGIWKL